MKHEIVLKIQIQTPPQKILEALTVPEQLTRWLAHKAALVTTSPRTIRLSWPHHSFDVIYQECGLERVAIEWGSDKGVGRELSFLLTAVDTATVIQLMHRGFADTDEGHEMFLGHIEGWTFYLCNLKTVLERDYDLRNNQPPGSLAC